LNFFLLTCDFILDELDELDDLEEPDKPAPVGGSVIQTAVPGMSPGQLARRFPFPEEPSPTAKLKRQDAKIANGLIVGNKRFLSAFASLRFKTLVASFTDRMIRGGRERGWLEPTISPWSQAELLCHPGPLAFTS